MNNSKTWEHFKKNKSKLTRQQAATIKGQIIAGDTAGAIKGINRIIARSEDNGSYIHYK